MSFMKWFLISMILITTPLILLIVEAMNSLGKM